MGKDDKKAVKMGEAVKKYREGAIMRVWSSTLAEVKLTACC